MEKGKNTQAAEDRRAAKRESFESGARKRSNRTTMMGLAVAAVVVAAAAFVIFGGPESGHTAVRADGGAVKIALDKVSDGQAHYYSYRGQNGKEYGKEMKFFVLKSSDGVVRAAFDACDVCYKSGLGYHQEGDQMVCNNCGQRFPSVRINEIKGGCNPAPLARETQGNELVIAASEIEAGAWYFQP